MKDGPGARDPRKRSHVGTRQTRPAPKRIRPARRRDALCDHRRVAGHLVRAAAAACADGAPEVKGRQWDYPFGANLNYIPRSEDGVSFAELRGLADALPLLRAVIETRKDQIAAQSFAIRSRNREDLSASSQAIDQVTRFFARPDRRRSFADWLRMLLEEMLVIDAATIYPRYNRGGSLYALDIIDGATIKPLIGEDGRAPEPPDPAYQQILKGIPAADFSAVELLYLPRNLRAHRLYGMSPVEQIALTVNIALRRDASTLDYYRTGSSPDAFATLPKEWTADQIRSFQDYFDALMSGNLARRRQTKFMPADFKLIEARQPPLKDQYDEWLARIICYAFSVPVSPFVSQVNRATGETMRQQATQEGLVPLKAWVKSALDHVIQECMNEPALEFVWVGDDAIDPLEQAQTLNILVAAGIKTREEARADLGLAPTAGAGARKPHRRCCIRRGAVPRERRPQRFRGIEQKENISLTAYVAFPVAPIFMISSFDLGSGWTPWPYASTALSTPIFLDDRALHPHGPEHRLPIGR